MKKFLLFATVACCAAAAEAQTLNIYQGPVCVRVAAADAGDMTYDNGTTLTVAGRVFDIADIDSVVVNAQPVAAGQVQVAYTDGAARVVIPADVAPYLSANVSGGHVSITASEGLAQEVNYVLSGASADGSFTQTGSYKATLTLQGLQLTSTRGAAIDMENGKRIRVVLADGTVNSLTDAPASSVKACFYVRGHAEFEGGGTLNLTGRTAHAFASKEYTELRASLGHIRVLSAAADGLHIGQYFIMKGGSVTIAGTKGDGIDVSPTKKATDKKNGQLFISGGNISLTLGNTDGIKGLKADSAVTISGGNISISGSGNGQKGLKVGTDLLINQAQGGETALTISLSGTTFHKGEPDESKLRGIKVGGNFTFDGGTIHITTPGKKAKEVAVDGTYTYKSGTINCTVSSATQS